MLKRLLAPRVEVAYALMRFFVGAMFAFHGVQKLFGVLTEHQPRVMSQLWLGGVIELVCGAAVALGVMTRWAALLCSGTMAVAYLQFHWKLQLGAQLWPAVNKGEPALVYAFVFLFIACRGGGRAALAAD